MAVHKALKRIVIKQILTGANGMRAFTGGGSGQCIGQVKELKLVKAHSEHLAAACLKQLVRRLGSGIQALGKVKQCGERGELRRLSAVIAPTGHDNARHAMLRAGIKLQLGGSQREFIVRRKAGPLPCASGEYGGVIELQVALKHMIEYLTVEGVVIPVYERHI